MADEQKVDSLLKVGQQEGDTPPPEQKTPPEGEKKQETPPPEGDKAKVAKRPDNIPEKFWDADKGVFRQDDVLKSYSELEKEIGKMKAASEPPKEYKVNIPADFADRAEIPADDPMLTSYLAHAKDKKYSQAKVDEDVGFFLKFMWDQHNTDLGAEIERGGGVEKVTARVKTLNGWAKNNLSEKSRAVMEGIATSADVLDFLEEVMKKAAIQVNPPDGDGKVEEELTDATLSAKMKDERYWNPTKRDPNFVKEVTEGFQKLYGKKTG